MASRGYTGPMQSIGIRQLKNHLSEYLRRVRAGEGIVITSHGDVIAELRLPELALEAGTPPGLRELVRRETTREVVRNDPSIYRSARRISVGITARELLDWERADR